MNFQGEKLLVNIILISLTLIFNNPLPKKIFMMVDALQDSASLETEI